MHINPSLHTYIPLISSKNQMKTMHHTTHGCIPHEMSGNGLERWKRTGEGAGPKVTRTPASLVRSRCKASGDIRPMCRRPAREQYLFYSRRYAQGLGNRCSVWETWLLKHSCCCSVCSGCRSWSMSQHWPTSPGEATPPWGRSGGRGRRSSATRSSCFWASPWPPWSWP